MIIISPLMLIITLLVRIYMGSPIMFTQTRPGLNGKCFVFYKFRTMSDACDEKGMLLPEAERITRFGSFLRKSSLDELPQLINVLNGSISLVGPRPLLVEYLPLYNNEQLRRHEVRPGITGWAQINGRNAISWEEKFKLDVWYVNNHSFWLDVRILLLTVIKIFTREGINADEHVTMEKFKGKG